ncbi:MAG: response regulator [Candidatus Pacebacteria bacterium]|nr:response regulator [Candidatus Paceibacterota bacterium]MCF7857489.1 response regulator [Candidatus Paceibacterota bacterium]
MKILLVDDDAFLRDMYATKFRELKHTINVAETAESALVKLQADTYDAVLLDMIMPGMTGVDLLKQIQKEKIGGNPKFIMLTNQSEESDREAALAAGAAGYIVKAELIPSEVVAEVLKLVSKK